MRRKLKTPSDMEKVILRAIRNSGMTQLELEGKSGVPQGTLSRFMTEDPLQRRNLTLPVADRLCKALGLKLVRKRGSRKGRKNA